MSVGEKIEKFFVETDWKQVGNKIKKTIIYVHDKVEEQKRAYLDKKIKEDKEKNKK